MCGEHVLDPQLADLNLNSRSPERQLVMCHNPSPSNDAAIAPPPTTRGWCALAVGPSAGPARQCVATGGGGPRRDAAGGACQRGRTTATPSWRARQQRRRRRGAAIGGAGRTTSARKGAAAGHGRVGWRANGALCPGMLR
eukprot:TRINITY_DN1267_c0_g1_i1.p2 TRINITY_DN1267_c0_g1~~TRINITY_DN1267_c0_g1_i1.p2  ORF type:complete len:140 (+),score=4.02 TRINITY_DN1267_c0_g1_i1:255-674(+)